MKPHSFLRHSLATALICLACGVLYLPVWVEDLPQSAPQYLTLPSVESTSSLHWLCESTINRWSFLAHTPIEPEPSPAPLPTVTEHTVEEVPESNWITTTMEGNVSQVEEEGIFVNNQGKVIITPDHLQTFSSLQLEEDSDQPQILIYHSHGTEAFAQTEGYTYVESDAYRTLDMDLNITSVGKAMADVFTQAGYQVIHDDSLHDYPDYNQSYQNSAVMLEEYIAQYPSLVLIFDVHRDALATADGTPYQLLSADPEVAQVMFVVGTNGGGYAHPLWQDNFSLALTLQQDLLQYADFPRPITLRTSRYNQQQSTGALLVEIGGHGNTFPQARNAGILFAQSVVDTLAKQGI